MSAYLEEHLPLLRSLHASLGLPSTSLQEDETRIDAAIKAVVVSIVKERETEVENWKEAISVAKRDVACIARALGEKPAGKLEDENEPLPRQHEKLVQERERLEVAYTEQLQKIEELQAALTALATLLGSPFEAPKPLQPIAGNSNPIIQQQQQQRSSLGRVVSNTGFRPDRVGTKKRSLLGPLDADEPRDVWLDLGGQLLEKLKAEEEKAIKERDSRRLQLFKVFHDLLWLHDELDLPPLPLVQPHHFPIDLLPSRANEETPGAYARYEKQFARFMAANPLDVVEEGTVVEEKGLDDLQPELGLIAWVNEIQDLWNDVKARGEERIQQIYDQIEPHWMRMPEVGQNYMDAFFDVNQGSGESTIKAYEAELERVLELRRASLSTFMKSIRLEIEGLWLELMFCDAEKDEFVGFIDDNFTEELLKAHEEYVELLRAEIESKSALLPKVREWHTLVADEEELERTVNDPNRFKMRGGAMLREEKLRKRVGVLKPKIEAELLSSLPRWEDENKRPFMVQGERVVDKIHDELEAKEAAKEAKKRARQGLGPIKTVRATPAPSTTKSQASSTLNRKRAAPEATPLHGYGGNGLKKQRVVSVNTASSLKPGLQSRIPSSISSTMGRRLPQHDPNSPTPIPCGLPRAPPMNGANIGSGYRSISNPHAPTSSVFTSHAQSRIPSLTTVTTSRMQAPSSTATATMASLGRAEGRKPRRQSFKPRHSTIPPVGGGIGIMGIAGAKSGRPSWDLGQVGELVEEEEERAVEVGVDEDDW